MTICKLCIVLQNSCYSLMSFRKFLESLTAKWFWNKYATFLTAIAPSVEWLSQCGLISMRFPVLCQCRGVKLSKQGHLSSKHRTICFLLVGCPALPELRFSLWSTSWTAYNSLPFQTKLSINMILIIQLSACLDAPQFSFSLVYLHCHVY